MTVENLLKEYPNPSGILWYCKYSFKSRSNFMFHHTKPTPVVITAVGRHPYVSIRISVVSEKTGQVTKKTNVLGSREEIFLTKEECVEHYKDRIKAQIADVENEIIVCQAKIGKLNKRIDDL